MDIVAVYTLQGMIMGNRVMSLLDGVSTTSVTLEKPVLVVPTQTGCQMVPMLALSTDKVATIPQRNMLFDGVFTPHLEIVNEYNARFGSGIQIATSM